MTRTPTHVEADTMRQQSFFEIRNQQDFFLSKGQTVNILGFMAICLYLTLPLQN